MKKRSKSSSSEVVTFVPPGQEDGIVRHLLSKGRPITRENYLAVAYPDGIEDWGAEHEVGLPLFLQNKGL